MVLIALSIIVLVLCSRYKQEPMTNSRTGITVTTIITAVITFFELTGVVALGVMNGIFGGDAFRQMLYDAIASGELDFEDFATANEAMNFALSVVNAVFIVSIIVCILVAAFGIFATVIGFKTMADKTLTAAAAANTAARNHILRIPSPEQASHRPPFTLKLNLPFWYPLALASGVDANKSLIISNTPV